MASSGGTFCVIRVRAALIASSPARVCYALSDSA